MLMTSPAHAGLWRRISVGTGVLLGGVHGDGIPGKLLASPTAGLEVAMGAPFRDTTVHLYLGIGGAYALAPYLDGEAIDGSLSWISVTPGVYIPLNDRWGLDIHVGRAKATARLTHRTDRGTTWGFLFGGGALRQLGDGPLHLGGRLRWFRVNDPDFTAAKTDHGLLTVVLAWIP